MITCVDIYFKIGSIVISGTPENHLEFANVLLRSGFSLSEINTSHEYLGTQPFYTINRKAFVTDPNSIRVEFQDISFDKMTSQQAISIRTSISKYYVSGALVSKLQSIVDGVSQTSEIESLYGKGEK